MPPKGGSGRRRPAESGAAAKEWGHSEGMQLSEIDLDAEYDGTVTNVNQFGVFVDFGAVKDGLLKVPAKIGRGFKRGMEVKNLAILSCDPDSGRVVLTPQDETVLPEPPAPREGGSQGGGKGGAKGGRGKGGSPPGGGRGALKDGGAGGDGKAKSKTPREWGHAEGTPLEEVHEGEVWDGVVTNVSPYGVFVDIGAVRDARLSVPVKVGRRFYIGDTVPDCKVEKVELEGGGRITVTIDDPEEVVKDLPPKERTKRSQSVPKAKSSARPDQAPATRPQRAASVGAKAKPRAKQAASSIERLRVGQVVDGFVSNKNGYGVFVDIGVGKDAKLLVPKNMMSRFRKDDEICGMVLESVDLEKMQIAVSLEDPELDGGNEELPRSAGPKASAKSQPKAKAKSQPKAKKQDQDWAHPNARAISSFRIGHIADGVVTNIGAQAVFIDIGAVRDGVLKLPKAVCKQFQVGDEVHGMLVESVDASTERVSLSLEDPELKEPGAPASRGGGAAKRQAKSPEAKKASGGPPASKAKAKAEPQPKAKGKAKAKAKAEAKSWGHTGGTPLEELEVGSEVCGVVTNRGRFGVFLDIGAVKDGKLRLEKDDWKKFRPGDEVEEMVIEHVDVSSEQITLALTYELGDEPEELVEEVQAAARQPKAKAKPGTAALPAPPRAAAKTGARPSSRGMATRPATATAKARR